VVATQATPLPVTAPLLRVVRGELDDTALAALTTVLLARAARQPSGSGPGSRFGPGPPTGERRHRARWRCPTHRSPVSWHRPAGD
jgi:hypothetical protein